MGEALGVLVIVGVTVAVCVLEGETVGLTVGLLVAARVADGEAVGLRVRDGDGE